MSFYTNAQTWGNSILVRGYNKTGAFQTKVPFSPTMFVKATKKQSDYKLLNGTLVESFKPGTIKETKEFIEKYKEVETFPVYGQTNYTYQYLSETYPEEIRYDSKKIRVHFLDIESESEFGFPRLDNVAERINAITIYDTIEGQSFTFGFGEFKSTLKNSIYKKCKDEADMLKEYILFHSTNYPDVMTGWFSNGFDIPYIARRVEKVLGEQFMNKLSPWGNVNNSERIYNGDKEYSTTILGISLIDYLDLYKKFVLKPRESYKLDFIAEVELGENKLDHSEYASFKDFYTKNFQKFVDYNIHDTLLVFRLEQKLKLLEVLFTIAYIAKINYEDVFSPVKTWDTIIYNYLKERNIVIPQQKYSRKEDYPGGYVKEPIKGMHNWIVSFDLQSSYPHQIMQYAISPENFVGERLDVSLEDLVNKKVDLSELKERNLTMTANGWLYEKKEGIFPALAGNMYEKRAEAKKEMKEWKKKLIELKEEAKKRGLINDKK